jgi:hypothetical protein
MQQCSSFLVKVALVSETHHGLLDQRELIRAVIEYRNAHSIPFFPFASLNELAIESKCIHLRLMQFFEFATNAR